MDRRASRWPVLVLTLAAVAACSGLERPEFVALDNVKVRGARLDGRMKIRADALLRNPNAVDLEIVGVDLHLAIDGKAAAEIREAGISRLVAGGTTAVPLHIEVPVDVLYEDLGDLLDQLGSERTVELELTGAFRVKALGVELEVPVRQRREVDLKL